MENSLGIIEKASNFVCEFIRDKMPEKYVFHDVKHTKMVVKTALEIADASGISPEDREILELAAWFHDTGYAVKYRGHESESMKIAVEFLSMEEYPDDKIESVTDCIKATIMPQSPGNQIEMILCDADLSNFGRKKFFEHDKLLRKELDAAGINKYSDKEWLLNARELLLNHSFHTEYARNKFAERKQKNIELLNEMIAGNEAPLEKSDAKVKEKGKDRKKQKKQEKNSIDNTISKDAAPARRGIETMFRNSLRGHLQLSAIADSKANIMQSVSAIIISIIIPMLIPRLSEDTYLLLPTASILLVCILTIVFATISTIPKVTEGKVSREDINNKQANLLFFGNFYNMEIEDFEWGMKEMMKDKDYLYSSMIKDFYFLGKVLSKKYRFLRISYAVFMFGMILVVAAFVISYLMHRAEISSYMPNT